MTQALSPEFLSLLARPTVPAELGVPTLADLQAIPTPKNGLVIEVVETGAVYQFDTSSSTTTNGWTVLPAADRTAGRWLLKSTSLSVAPLGGANDDWNRLFGIGGVAVTTASVGVQLFLRAGTWLCNTVQTLPRDLWLACDPGVNIVSSLTSTGGAGHLNSVFSYDGFTAPLGATSLTAPATAGSLTLLAGGLAGLSSVAEWIGQEILLQDETSINTVNQRQAYIVRDATGTGPYTLTLDRPLLRDWPSTTNIDRGTRAKNIRVYGNGAKITGTGDRAISFISAWDCHVEGFEIDAPGFDAEYTVSFDSGSFQSGYERIRVKSSKATSFALEACEGTYAKHCYSEYKDSNKFNAAFLVQAGYNVTLFDCHASGRTGSSGAGLLVGFVSDVVGSRGVRVENCSFRGNLIGVDVSGGSQDVDIVNCDISNNTSDGVRVQSLTSPTRVPGRVRVRGGEIKRNGGAGINVDGCKGVRADAVFFEENTGGQARTINGGELKVHGCVGTLSVAATAQFRSNSATDVMSVVDTTMGGTPTGFPYGIWCADGDVSVKGCRFNYDTGDQTVTFVVQQGGKLYLEDVKSLGIIQTNGLIISAGSAHIGPGVDLSGASVPFTLSGGVVDGIAFGGISTIAMTTSNHTATWAEYAASTLALSGTLGTGRNLILPNVQIPWVVKNGTDQVVTVIGASGTGVAIPVGMTSHVVFDGTNFVEQLRALNVSARSDLKSIAVPTDGLTIAVAETSAFYQFDASSSATADDWVTLVANDGTSGRWLLKGGSISLAPLVSTDNAPRVQTVAEALGYKGKLVLLPGAWEWDSVCNLTNANGVCIEMLEGTNIGMTLTAAGGGGGATQVAFRASFNAIRAAGVTGATAAIGDTSILVTTDLANIGERISLIPLGITNLAQMFTVTSKSGSAPNITLGLDDPVEIGALSGSSVQAIVPAQDITIRGNGATISGTGDRACEFNSTESCVIERLKIVGAGLGAMAASFDIGGRRNRFRNVTVFGGDLCTGLSLESQNGSSIEDCDLHDCGKPGDASASIFLPDSTNFRVSRCRIYSGQYGILMTIGDAGSVGVANGTIDNCTILHPRLVGVQIVGGKNITLSNIILRNIPTRSYTPGFTDGIIVDASVRNASGIRLDNISVENISGYGLNLLGTDITGSNIKVSGCAKSGIRVANSSIGVASNVSLTNVASRNNTERGVFLDGSPGNGSTCDVTQLTTSNNVGSGLYLLGSGGGGGRLSVDTWYSDTDNSGGLEGLWTQNHASGTLRILHASVKATSANAWYGVFPGAGTTEIDDYSIDASAASNAAFVDVQSTGTFKFSRVRVTAGSLGIGVFAAHGFAAKIRRGPDVDATITYNIVAPAAANFGTVQVNGTTPVPVSAAILADDFIGFTAKTLGGTQGETPKVVAGTQTTTGFNVFATAGDTSTYNWTTAR